jgi:biopolymer transport protein ExbB
MFRLRAHVVAVVVFFCGLITAPDASAWWNDDWQFRKELTLDLSAAGANIPANATDVPVLVRLSIANFPYFNDARPDGADLRFISADDKTPLKFHVEKWDAQAQIALLWVRLPLVTGGMNADKVFLYYGSPEGVSAGDVAGTWDTNQALAYHFGAAPPATQDATGYKNEPQNFTAEINPGSLIGSGLRFDGTKSFMVPAAPSLAVNPAQGYTISAWVKAEGAQQQTVLVSMQDQARELTLGIESERAFARGRATGAEVLVSQQAGTLVGEWHHVALRVGGGNLALLVDGALVGQSQAVVPAMNVALAVGGASAGSNYFRGEMDELLVANIARSDAWLRAAATSQGMVAPLVVYGGDTQKESGGHDSYFASTLRNVTVDGWAIIGVLAVMFLASVLIMFGKVLYLNRVAGGNKRFLVEFQNQRESTGEVTEQGSAFGISTLWALYRDGMRETNKRTDGQALSAARVKTLSPQAIEAIRATMDASMTRATQRLQSQMVWLTIAISGGPFLGLLGTVVGVMITFAAIAASGEVNVNAIAPGTAAALVATVAGLGVAIPCLFGYNYLNTRIKEIVADMRVFVDEFVARQAETYS